jgi:LCP family protein required for cell wall assembly
VPFVSAVLSPASSTVENFLLVGSDSRAAGDPNTGDTGGVTGNRSDTIMVLRIDRQGGPASLLSIPRDLYVEIAGTGDRNRINAAFNSGPATLVETVQQSLGIPVHHYVEIDFVGFKDLVDALGGVTVCFFFPARDFNTGLNIEQAGCQELDGTQSLAFARSRRFEELRDGQWVEDPTSDLGRTSRQRMFVNVALQEMFAAVKSDPLATGDLVSALSAALSFDEELDPVQAASSLRTAMATGLQPVALPTRGDTIDDKSVLLMTDAAGPVLDYFRGASDVVPVPG